jgi:hypothetical protein
VSKRLVLIPVLFSQMDLREICFEDGRWMELVQNHRQRRVTAFNFRVALLKLLFLYLVQNKQSGQPNELQTCTAAPEVITLPNVAEIFSSHGRKGLINNAIRKRLFDVKRQCYRMELLGRSILVDCLAVHKSLAPPHLSLFS